MARYIGNERGDRERLDGGVGERKREGLCKLLNYRGECRPRECVATVSVYLTTSHISFFDVESCSTRRKSLSLCVDERFANLSQKKKREREKKREFLLI